MAKFTIQLLTGQSIEVEGDDLKDALEKAVAHSANLDRANLDSANLYGANLDSANLYSANLCNAALPAPTTVLLANWGTLSNDLCRECMCYDAHNHPNPEKFNEWMKTGKCPYADEKIQRCVNFAEESELWTPDLLTKQPLSAFELMVRLIREKCTDCDYHDHPKAA